MQLWKKYVVDSTTSVFTTVGDTGTPWHPQFFRAVTSESQRFTEDSYTVVFLAYVVFCPFFCGTLDFEGCPSGGEICGM